MPCSFGWQGTVIQDLGGPWVVWMDKNLWEIVEISMAPSINKNRQDALTRLLRAAFKSLVSLQFVIWDIPKKATLAKMKTILVSLCASDRPNKSRQTHSNRAKEVAFNIFAITLPVGLWYFRKDWNNPKDMLIPNLFRFFEFSLLKDSQPVKLLLGLCVCLCERQRFLPIRQSPEKKFGLLK